MASYNCLGNSSFLKVYNYIDIFILFSYIIYYKENKYVWKI